MDRGNKVTSTNGSGLGDVGLWASLELKPSTNPMKSYRSDRRRVAAKVHFAERNVIALASNAISGDKEEEAQVTHALPRERKLVADHFGLLHQDLILLPVELVRAEHGADVTDGRLEDTMDFHA